MRNLCAIFLFALLGALLSSCAWLYQVTGTEDPFSSNTVAPMGTSAWILTDTVHEDSESAPADSETQMKVLEGCYSNGNFVLELFRSKPDSEEFHLIIYTPKYSMRMFTGMVPAHALCEEMFSAADMDDAAVLLTASFFEDGSSLSVRVTRGDTESADLSGVYRYQNATYETEPLKYPPTIAAGVYTHDLYEMHITYSGDYMDVTLRGLAGVILFSERTPADAPLTSAIFHGEYGSVILVPVQDGLGPVIVTGRAGDDSFHAFAGTYILRDE